jgi:uncharacterized membrane protein (DUF485 family)
MSTLTGKLGVTSKGELNNSSGSDNSSDGEYELQEIKPQVHASRSSVLRRQRKECCNQKCAWDATIIILAFSVLYIFNGLYTWALIEAMLSNSTNTLIVFAVVWLVFCIVFFTLVFVLSNRKLRERQEQADMAALQEQKRRDDIKAALDKDN